MRDGDLAKSKLSQDKSNLKREIETLEQKLSSANTMYKTMEEKWHDANSQCEIETKVC